MKKYWFVLICLIIIIVITLTSCNKAWGTKYVTNPKKYGKWETYLDIPTFLPDSIDDYQVNSYSYTLYAFMDICYEIFLDITVSEEQFKNLIKDARNYTDKYTEKVSYYDDDYTEIIYKDSYHINDYYGESSDNVGFATIYKVIYNLETLNVIYVSFETMDSNVYDLKDLTYFNRFSIKQEEYVEHLN